MSISKTPALCKAAKLVKEVSTAKCRNTTLLLEWWSQTGSNRRPEACKATALPTELWPPFHPHELTHFTRSRINDPSLNLVGLGRLELPTSRLSSARSNQLSYKPGTRGQAPAPKPIRTVLRPREKEKRRRRCSANGPVTFRP